MKDEFWGFLGNHSIINIKKPDRSNTGKCPGFSYPGQVMIQIKISNHMMDASEEELT